MRTTESYIVVRKFCHKIAQIKQRIRKIQQWKLVQSEKGRLHMKGTSHILYFLLVDFGDKFGKYAIILVTKY